MVANQSSRTASGSIARTTIRSHVVRKSALLEKTAGLASPSIGANVQSHREGVRQMMKLGTVQVWVNDQDEALAFYTRKLGWDVRSDQTIPEMGNFRWLTVGPKGQPDISVALMAIPGPPIMDAQTAQQVRDVMAKGFAGTLFLTTDDVHAAYKQLKERGVEFAEEPREQPYGIDTSFRDPSGNNVRLAQVREPAQV